MLSNDKGSLKREIQTPAQIWNSKNQIQKLKIEDFIRAHSYSILYLPHLVLPSA